MVNLSEKLKAEQKKLDELKQKQKDVEKELTEEILEELKSALEDWKKTFS